MRDSFHLFSRHSRKHGMDEKTSLLQSLDETNRDLTAARAGFNSTHDPDLIEFYLYEINALQARHTYLLRQVKALNLGSVPAPSDSSAGQRREAT